METITKAALVVECGDKRHLVSLPRPARHSDILDFVDDNADHFTVIHEGFMTSDDRFVTRKEAAAIAAAANQIISNDFDPHCLYTEDIW